MRDRLIRRRKIIERRRRLASVALPGDGGVPMEEHNKPANSDPSTTIIVEESVSSEAPVGSLLHSFLRDQVKPLFEISSWDGRRVMRIERE